MIIALQTLIFFRESLLAVLDGLLRPYYKRFFSFSRQSISDEDESEDQVFAEFDDEKGVVFYPAMYAQRYAAVTDCLMDERWSGKLEKVVDLGYHDVSFIKYLKEIPGVKRILGVDLESIPLRCSSDLVIEYTPKRESPLQVTLFQGNAADPDYRLIGCDAVIAIEMIEHMLPHDLDRLVHTVFGFVKPWIAIFTTPNGDFNPLFKSMEKNGLRRLDHFFEWSREQFHDWCSNIVLRYPQYTVVCKGIGPGPPGTLHYGCCSQLALFSAKEYTKQQDLDLNSLALVANAKDQNNLSELIGSIESMSDGTERHMLCLPSCNIDTTPDSSADSVSTIIMANALTIMEPLEYRDKTSQCNLDTEVGKSFMFEDESWFNVVMPRKKIVNRVYEIEDVASRLNCSTFQVKKFSKTTQNLMAKNKIDSLVHTREVVDEIRHLTKMLNFDKEVDEKGDGSWRNFNWGENAPYWNQFYKVVREYSYPFETKSEEARIVDLISEEINRLIDSQYDQDYTVDMNKIEIPLSYLMDVVSHITDDVERVKDLLEWNGYEVVDDVVIYTRIIAEAASITTRDDWPENDTLSDVNNSDIFDTTDIHSTSLSDGSTIAPDYTGRCIRRALDQKVRRLRSMLTADEDIACELDRVVCRLMKLALRTSRVRQHPPPTRWMQCKLFDLLSLTEKAIDRRRRRFIENFPLDYDDRTVDDTLALVKIQHDDSVNMLVNKYQHLVDSFETKDVKRNNANYGGFDFDENLSDTSNEYLKDYEFVNEVVTSPTHLVIEPITIPNNKKYEYYTKEESKLQRIQAWVDEDVEVVSYPNHDVTVISSGDTDHSATNIRHKLKKMSRKRKISVNSTDKRETKSRKISSQKKAIEPPKIRSQDKKKSSKSKLVKKTAGKKSSYSLLVKANFYKTSSNSLANLRNKKLRDYLNSVKPIPGTYKELQHSDLNDNKKLEENIEYLINIDRMNEPVIEAHTDVAATKESLLVNIVTENMEETIALRRTIGTEAEDDPTEFEQETVLGSLLNVMRNDSFCNKSDIVTEDVHSQTIFLNDINEPSTSKGVRHVSMDVQCGPDMMAPVHSTLSTTTSFTKIPKIFNNGIRIGDSESELPAKNSDFGTCTGENNCYCRTISPRTKSVGIIIKDSDTNMEIPIRKHTGTCTPANDARASLTAKETELIKPISSGMKMEDSGSEGFGSFGSPVKSHSTSYASEIALKPSISKDTVLGPKFACLKYARPRLSRGGVHVHSYKDMQESEDVLYQGHWQRCRPKALTRKRVVFNTASVKKLTDLTKKLRDNSKEKLQAPEKKAVKLEVKTLNRIQVRVPLCEMARPKDEPKMKNNPAPNKSLKMTKCNRCVSKVPSKHPISTPTINKPKTALVPRMPATLPQKVIKKEPVKVRNTNTKPSQAELLKRKIMRPILTKSVLNKSIDSAKKATNETKGKPIGQVSPLVRCKTEIIKKELLKFDDSPRDIVSYVVLRNECENRSNAKNTAPPKNIVRRNDSPSMRNHSPSSQNSSTCSSPNSVATVRIVSNRSKLVATKRISSSSNQDNIDADTVTPVRNKKFTKKTKSSRRADPNANDLDNKENIPQSSNGIKKESEGKIKNTYLSTPKNVYRAQVATETPQNMKNSLSRHKTSTPRKLSEKSSKADDLIQASPSSLGKYSKASSPRKSPMKVRSSQKVSTPSKTTPPQSIEESTIPLNKTRSNSLCTISNDSDNKDNDIAMSLKKLIEERLDFISYFSDDLCSIDSKTVILSRENLVNYNMDERASPESFKTVIDNEDYDTALLLQFDLETAVNRTFDSSVDSTINAADDGELTDTDGLSFKTTMATSRASEYFLADNEMNFSQASFTVTNSVRDIFERKNQLTAQSEGGNLASQAFSGFSINAVAGDRPDPVALVDSETGSLTLDTARQATSEEVFVSGRSSGSYESCPYDDEAMIPYWLFHINDQFVDEEEEEEEPEAPNPVELPEPVFDMNGNVVAAGAGAGDGRGMHSDHSQDSSGRGTSTTSSDPSSGVQSEAILIDPSAFNGQFDLPAVSVTAEIPESSPHEAGENIGEFLIPERSGRRNPVVQLLATSDMDADVSSLDTDVQDSS